MMEATLKLIQATKPVKPKRDISVTGHELALVFKVATDAGEKPFQIVIPTRLVANGEVFFQALGCTERISGTADNWMGA